MTRVTRLSPVENKGYVDGALAGYVPQIASAKASSVTAGHLCAHRGGGSSQGGQYQGPYPEETMEAFRAGIAAGAQSINVHTRLLADGTSVCMHDTTVDRTTGQSGNVNDYTLSAWKTLTWDNSQPGYGNTGWQQHTFPTFDEVVREFGGKRLIIAESAFTSPQTAGQNSAALVATLQKYGCTNSAIIQSFSPQELTNVASAGIATMYLPPAYGNAGYDAASITTAMANGWAAGQPKRVGINGFGTVTATVTTTSGSAVVTATAGTSFTSEHVGALVVSTTGIPPYSTIASVQSATQATLSANATASGSVTMTWMPTPGYVSNLVAAGYEVWTYTVLRRWQRDWLLGLGVTGLIADEPGYLGSSSRIYSGAIDPLSLGVWPAGFLPADQGRGRGSLLNGGVQLDFTGSSGQQMACAGHLCPPPSLTSYTINTTVVFDQLDTDTTRYATIEVCCPDDKQTSCAASGTNGYGYVNGYQLLIRQNGQIQLFRTNIATQASSQVGSTQTGPTISVAGTSVAVTIQVTATTIVVTLVSGGTTYGPWTFTESTYRGGYFHLGKGQSSNATKLLVTYKSTTVS